MSMPRLASCTSLRWPLARVRTELPFAARASWVPAGGGRPLAPTPPLAADSPVPRPVPPAVAARPPGLVEPRPAVVVAPRPAVVVPRPAVVVVAPCGLLVVGPWLAAAPPVVGP